MAGRETRHNHPLLWTAPRRGSMLFFFWSCSARGVAGRRASLVMRQLSAPTLRRWGDDGYNRLGCLATLGLFALVIVGLLITTRAADAAVICLEFGRDTYFVKGVRPVPHRGFFLLTDGHQVSNVFQAVFIVFWAVSFVLWITLAVLLVVCVNEMLCTRSESTQVLGAAKGASSKRGHTENRRS